MRRWASITLLCLLAGPVAAQTLSDDPAFALYRRAVQAAEAKDYVQATALAREAIAQYPDHVLAWYLLGQASMGREAWGDAVAAFTNVVKRYPASFAGHRDLGLALERLGRVDEANAAFETALARRDDADLRLRLALMLWDRGRHDAARPHLEILARAESATPEVWLLLARAYYERSELAASERAFARAAALRDDGTTWFNLGVVRLRLNDAAGAQAAFTRAAAHADVNEQATRELDKLRRSGPR
jgi:tetratricopeptide (TPR) repeat protein